jgi:hypothetical protein
MLISTRLLGDGTHGHAERIQTFRSQACRTTFSARRDTALSRLKTPSRAGSQWGSLRWPKGWTLPPPNGSSALGKRPSPAFLTRAGEHAQTWHERCLRPPWLPHLQLEELRTRRRSSNQVVWLWMALDPCTKLLPVLQLGPGTQHLAPCVLPSLRQRLAAFLRPALQQ